MMSEYDSRCLTTEQWAEHQAFYKDAGWEWKFAPIEDRVYLRRHLSGSPNTDSEGWHSNE